MLIDKKKIKKTLQNCPYLVAIAVIWLFLTIGGVILLLYRDYKGIDWQTLCANPVFAVIMEREMHGGVEALVDAETAMTRLPERDAALAGQDTDKIPYVISTLAQESRASQQMQELFAHVEEQEKEKEQEQEEEETQIAGQTLFIEYPPVETNSRYYEDAGKYALTTEYPYVKVEDAYFDDALFLGDSRTMGISDYAGLEADFYCENGMTVYKLLEGKGVTYQKTGEKFDFTQIMQKKQYGKIYMMLGMNELGYGNTEYFLEHYQLVLEQIRQWQPQAIIFLMANLHVSREKNNLETEFNNININAKNAAIATLANGTDIFYLDSNPMFTDEEGLLKDDLTFDGVHLYANNYAQWKEFIAEHGVVIDNNGSDENAESEQSGGPDDGQVE
ncbi:MAG: GDSL-type esterase/lipase family protein [Roseburia sp.]|nr:GDSL-type esterase/lipase family protein [Roseburia sp.]